MDFAFVILATLTLAGALASMFLRNLVHCALSLVVTFAGLAGCYLKLGAEFVAWAQILVYVGAVAILLVFAILLTQGGGPSMQPRLSATWYLGLAVAGLVFASLAAAIGGSVIQSWPASAQPEPTVQQIGVQLMTKYVLPLEVAGLLLTAALIGAVIIAMPDQEEKK